MLDFGGQYSQLIARRIRECGVYAELLPHDTALEPIRERAPAGAGALGRARPRSTPRARRRCAPELLELGIPVLGICYGMQAMVRTLGGRVEAAEAGEFGRTELTLTGDGGRLLAGLPAEQQCWMSHRDSVFEPPAGLRGARRQPRLAGRRLRGPRARPLRDPVPPRGRPHPLRPADPRPLPARDRRLRRDLVAGVGDRRAGRADPRPGRRRGRDLRALGRGRLGDRGGARPPRDRRPAHLRARRPRPDAQERGRAGGRGDARARRQPRPRRGRRSASSTGSPASTTPSASARSSARSSSACSRTRPRSSPTSATSSRARSTRT